MSEGRDVWLQIRPRRLVGVGSLVATYPIGTRLGEAVGLTLGAAGGLGKVPSRACSCGGPACTAYPAVGFEGCVEGHWADASVVLQVGRDGGNKRASTIVINHRRGV